LTDSYLHIIHNPLSENYLTLLRDKKTSSAEFSAYLNRLSVLIAYECSFELSLKKKKIKTPLDNFTGSLISDDILIVPILRAGLGFVQGFTQVMPNAKVSHIGIYRNEKTLKPVRYYFKFPRFTDPSNTIAFILDPMIATGGSVNSTILELNKRKVNKIVVASLLASPYGIKEIHKKHKIKIFTCSVDKCLNKDGFIVPGLGDAGDRLFGT
jgi:uracil phosphoribosyltransferase